ncbi:MAG TPA: type II toxin-antitoxin system prevent-host-death family antitoxin [Bacillota bacterium]|nr:type II toxin-antitoxin system prevent-host-death family antitoxin [Bacillota bacterium]
MNAINYSELRKNLKTIMDEVIGNHEPVIITRRKGENMVLMSYEDYAAFEETAYLLRSPKNASRLRESVASYEAGKGQERSLIKDNES